MARGRRILRLSALLVVAIASLAVAGGWWLLSTNAGRSRVARFAESSANALFEGRGRLVIGRLANSTPGNLLAYDVAILDTLGQPMLTVGRLQGAMSLGALNRGVVRITALVLDSVSLNVSRDFTGPFNLQWLIAGDTTRPRDALRVPGLGDDIRIDQLQLRNATVVATYPWEPNALFVGAERDSVIAVRDSLHELLRRPEGFIERRVVAIQSLFARELHVVTPDDAPGRIVIDSALLRVSDPPTSVTALRGAVQWYDDSLTFNADSITLPASRVAAEGMISWMNPGPVAYDVRIDGKEVGLADINWVWPLLPVVGRASAQVHMRTLANPDHLEVILTSLQAEAMSSLITGDIAMVAEVRDFLLHDVSLAFAPMSTQLVARLTENVLPPEVSGQLRGRFVAKKGGSLRALRLDTLALVFDDAVVAGARSTFAASGIVSIGIEPSARDVIVSNASVDLRSVRAVLPDLPPLVNGRVDARGRIATASLNAADLPELSLEWTDAEGHRASVSGRTAIRWNGEVMSGDVALTVAQFDLAAVARLDSTFDGRGIIQGSFSASGLLDSLPFKAVVSQRDLASGIVSVEGWLGARIADTAATAWRTAARVRVDSLNAAPWMTANLAPRTAVSGVLEFAGRGVGATVDTARVTVALTQPATERLTPLSIFAAGDWGSAALSIDSILALAPGAVFEANGGLARDSAGRESFRGSLRMDSLSVLRAELPRFSRMLADVDTALARAATELAADSLSGDLNLSVYGEGSFKDYLTSVAVAGQQVRVGSVVVGRLFGSARADNLPRVARFVAALTADSVEGIGGVRIATINAGIDDADASAGALRFDMEARDSSRLRLRGHYARGDDTLLVESDSVRFTYGNVIWSNPRAFALRDRADGFHIDSFTLVSNEAGVLRLAADVPRDSEINAYLQLDKFPAGELAAFALGTARLPGLVTGRAELTGIRADPVLTSSFRTDSLGTAGASISGVVVEASYRAQELAARVSVVDSSGRALRAALTLPADLRLQSVVGERIYTEELNGSIVADSVQLSNLPLRVAGLRDLEGYLNGRFTLGGTFDQPTIEGGIQLTGGTLFSDVLGIRPTGVSASLVAGGDSVSLAQFRFQSGPRASDTLNLSATVRRPLRDNPAVSMLATLNNVQLAHQNDGTDLDLSGTVQLSGRLPRPVLSADLFVPRANLVLDLTEARTVLDLNSPEALALLAPGELPTEITSSEQFTSLGEFLEARGVRIVLGDEVWVRTREAAVKLAGEVNVLEAAGQQLSLDGEVVVQRGTYRLDLGVVNRPFVIDSGRVRFFPQTALNPTVNIFAEHVVRGVDGRETPIDVRIGGTLEVPTVTLSTRDDAYASAPESEFISLLVFGAPTFALDGQSQQTVRAVTGLVLPAFSNAVEGQLQRLLPVFNTVQVSNAGGQSGEQLSYLSFLDNLSVTAGKQIGPRTYLRIDTGVCRNQTASSSGQGLNLWAGGALEYRIATGLTAQLGIDPGPSACSQLSGGAGQRVQLGFDLFKQWVF